MANDNQQPHVKTKWGLYPASLIFATLTVFLFFLCAVIAAPPGLGNNLPLGIILFSDLIACIPLTLALSLIYFLVFKFVLHFAKKRQSSGRFIKFLENF
jgi:type II secretory pathway component PulF